jgi:hypothetical protein
MFRYSIGVVCGVAAVLIALQTPCLAECENDQLDPRGMPISASPIERAAEARIQQKLDEKTELEFIETPLNDVIEFLKAKHDIEIQLDRRGLEEAAIEPDTPITRNLKGVSLRSALRLILREYDLTFVIRDEVLLITPRVAADEMPSIRVYQVCDFIRDGDPAEGDYATLIDVITSTVSPASWQETGGMGSIRAMPLASALVISANTYVHEEIDALLVTLRQARDAQRKK